MNDCGLYEQMLGKRDAVLAGCRVSPQARTRIMGVPFRPMRPKDHVILVDLKAQTRTVTTLEEKPQAAPRAEIQIPVTLRSGRRRLHDFGVPRRVRDVLETTCEVFEVETWELMSIGRCRRLARPRQTAYSLLKLLLRISLMSVGRIFKRDHTTCLQGLRKSADLRRTDLAYRHKYRTVVRRLREKWSADAEAAR